MHFGRPERDARRVTLLRAIHRRISVANEHVRVGAIGRRERDPDARGDAEFVTVDEKRFGEKAGDFFGEGRDHAGIAHGRQHDDEFIPAPARENRPAVERGLQALRNGAQKYVTDAVAEAVVHVFEPIEVEEKHGTTQLV